MGLQSFSTGFGSKCSTINLPFLPHGSEKWIPPIVPFKYSRFSLPWLWEKEEDKSNFHPNLKPWGRSWRNNCLQIDWWTFLIRPFWKNVYPPHLSTRTHWSKEFHVFRLVDLQASLLNQRSPSVSDDVFWGQRWLKHPLKQNKGGLVSKLNSDIIKHPCISFHCLTMSEVESQLAWCWDLDEANCCCQKPKYFLSCSNLWIPGTKISQLMQLSLFLPQNFISAIYHWTSWGPLVLIEFDHISPSSKMPEMQGHFGDRFPFLHDLFRL